MGRPAKRDGRLVDRLIARIEWDISQAEKALVQVLSSPDPWEHIEATEKALKYLGRARTSARDISEICLLARQRGRYKTKEGE